MQVVRASLKDFFDASETIPGTRKNHPFIDQSKSKLMPKLTSKDNTFLTFDFLNVFEKIDLVSFKTFSYIACTYGDFWWIGMVSEVNMDEQDVMVEVLHPHGPQKTFKWPRNPDRCHVPAKSILCTISMPVTSAECICNISDKEYDTILKSYHAFVNTIM